MRNPLASVPTVLGRISTGSGTDQVDQEALAVRRRRRNLPWVLRARTLQGYQGADPDFIVAGAQKAGSSSLFAYLAAHPQVAPPLVKEIHYFSLSARRGQTWYRRHFPVEAPGEHITGEASPFYMAHPLAMQRIALSLPAVKIVVILREPVSRLVSHYRHSVKLGHESLTLQEALEQEQSRTAPDLEAMQTDPFHPARRLQKFSYLRRSLYSEQVMNIQRLFVERAIFLRLEDMTETSALEPLCEFLGIRFEPQVPFEAHNVNRSTPTLPDGSIPDDVLKMIRTDATATCERLGWTPWEI